MTNHVPSLTQQLLISTRLQPGDGAAADVLNLFSGFLRDAKTAEAVEDYGSPGFTQLKQGANESRAGCSPLTSALDFSGGGPVALRIRVHPCSSVVNN